MRALVLLLAAAACCTHAFGGGDRFTEELDLQVLPDGHVYAGFRFGMHAPARSADFRVLPKPLMQILHHFSVEELHLSLTRGRWNYPQWGAAGLQPHPFGLLLAVNFYKHDHRREGWPHNGTLHGDVEEQWKGLVHALAGLFCASVNFLDVRSPLCLRALLAPAPGLLLDQTCRAWPAGELGLGGGRPRTMCPRRARTSVGASCVLGLAR